MEYVSLSRDTTEADLKQRREIINGTAHYVDQVAGLDNIFVDCRFINETFSHFLCLMYGMKQYKDVVEFSENLHTINVTVF